MTTNTNTSAVVLTTLKDVKALGRAPQKGDIVVPGSMAHRYIFKALKGELAEEARKYVTGEISRMKNNAQLWPEIPRAKAEAKTGVDAIVDGAFVPDMSDRQKPSREERTFSLLDQAISEFKQNKQVVDCGYAADPEDGEHTVTIREYREFQGKNGRDPFIVFTLREEGTGKTWDHLLSVPGAGAIREFIFSISRNNKGCLEGKDLAEALHSVTTGKVRFSVWTVKSDRNGRILTYFDLDKYQKFLYIQGTRKDNKLLRDQKRADNQALENAVVGADKAPWEE